MAKKQTKQPARLQEALVLHKYVLNLFGCKDLGALSRDLKDPALEGVDDEGVSRMFYALKAHLYGAVIKEEKLLEYDQNIVRHTREINEKRAEKIQWKYYQYLALLFTEIYLDRYFSDSGGSSSSFYGGQIYGLRYQAALFLLVERTCKKSLDGV